MPVDRLSLVKPIADAAFEMADIRSAFEHLSTGAQFGKVSLVA